MSKHSKISSHFSSSKSKGQKRVVSVRLKDDHRTNTSPPSDSWAWRKYGQKPIKGSPYPRGYYKCSTTKGCPARKQVERSKTDPHILLVTYSSDHNHPCPEYSKNKHRRPTITATSVSEDEEEEDEKKSISNDTDSNNTNTVEGPQMVSCAGEFGYFSDLEPTSCPAILDRCPILSDRGRISADAEMAMIFTRIVEGDESLIFSGLGELPECAAVLRWSDATSGRGYDLV